MNGSTRLPHQEFSMAKFPSPFQSEYLKSLSGHRNNYVGVKRSPKLSAIDSEGLCGAAAFNGSFKSHCIPNGLKLMSSNDGSHKAEITIKKPKSLLVNAKNGRQGNSRKRKHSDSDHDVSQGRSKRKRKTIKVEEEITFQNVFMNTMNGKFKSSNHEKSSKNFRYLNAEKGRQENDIGKSVFMRENATSFLLTQTARSLRETHDPMSSGKGFMKESFLPETKISPCLRSSPKIKTIPPVETKVPKIQTIPVADVKRSPSLRSSLNGSVKRKSQREEIRFSLSSKPHSVIQERLQRVNSNSPNLRTRLPSETKTSQNKLKSTKSLSLESIPKLYGSSKYTKLNGTSKSLFTGLIEKKRTHSPDTHVGQSPARRSTDRLFLESDLEDVNPNKSKNLLVPADRGSGKSKNLLLSFDKVTNLKKNVPKREMSPSKKTDIVATTAESLAKHSPPRPKDSKICSFQKFFNVRKCELTTHPIDLVGDVENHGNVLKNYSAGGDGHSSNLMLLSDGDSGWNQDSLKSFTSSSITENLGVDSPPKTPTESPVKSGMLTPRSTPQSTPKSTPRSSPSNSPQRSPKRISSPRRQNFSPRKGMAQRFDVIYGQEILTRWTDGLFYNGRVEKVDEKEGRCQLKYEDNSLYWSLFKDMNRFAQDGEYITCCVCQGDVSEKPNQIVLCDTCEVGYHQLCHSPIIDASEVQDSDADWNCRMCVFAMAVKKGGAPGVEEKCGQDLMKMKQCLPYDLNRLTWDAQHKTNVEQYYCYCGGPGVWYQKMLQCCRCKQWFHEACLQCLDNPLLFGDNFNIFVCALCNCGEEYVKRLDIEWPDLIHLSVFDLTLNGKKWCDLDEDILPWISENWEHLHGKNSKQEMVEFDKVENVLHSHRSRFMQKNERMSKGHKSLWALRSRVPPTRIQVMLPFDGKVNDDVMKTLKVKGRRSKIFVPMECKSPVALKLNPMRLNGAVDLKSRKAARRLLQATAKDIENNNYSFNQEYKGYTGSNDYSISTNSHSGTSSKKKKLPKLDRMIPCLENFEGANHPFKTELEQKIERSRQEQRMCILKFYQRLDEQDRGSYSGSTVSSDGPPVLVREEPITPLMESSEDRKGRRKSSRKSKGLSSPADLEPAKRSQRLQRRSSTLVPRNTPPDITDPAHLNAVKLHELSFKKWKITSVGNYFGYSGRSAGGEGFQVMGKRLNAEGCIQYLIQWDNDQVEV